MKTKEAKAVASPVDDLILRFLGFEPVPEIYQASDGSWWRTAGQAFLWDLIQRKMAELMRIGPERKEWMIQ